jgi:hypothetical protein
MQNDLTDFLYWIVLWLYLSRRHFQAVTFTSDLCAWRYDVQHLSVIICREEPDGLVVGLLSQPGFFWETDRGKRTPHAQTLIVCDWWTLDRGLQGTCPRDGAL